MGRKVIYHLLRHISNLPQPRGWERKIAEGPPCVVLASPGFLQSGPSRELLELWAPDPRNGLIITGYSIEGTLARVSDIWTWEGFGKPCIICVPRPECKPFPLLVMSECILGMNWTHDPDLVQDIMNEPETITSLKGHSIPRKISVDYISFSAHVDYSQNSDFIEQVKAQHVVCNLALSEQ